MDTALDELSLYRFGAIETEVKQLSENNHEIVKNISAIVVELNTINSNLNRMVDISNKITERITLLENDLQERIIRKKIYKSLITFYPALIVVLMILMNLDHQKIVEILTEIRLILPRLGN